MLFRYLVAVAAFVPITVAMAAAIAHLIASEAPWRSAASVGPFAAFGHAARIAVLGIEAVVDMSAEFRAAAIPRASSDKCAAVKPFRAVIAVGGATVRTGVIVSIGACGCHADADPDLSLCRGSGDRKQKAGNRSKSKNLESVHKFPCITGDR